MVAFQYVDSVTVAKGASNTCFTYRDFAHNRKR